MDQRCQVLSRQQVLQSISMFCLCDLQLGPPYTVSSGTRLMKERLAAGASSPFHFVRQATALFVCWSKVQASSDALVKIQEYSIGR
jgi:hypothetical protein